MNHRGKGKLVVFSLLHCFRGNQRIKMCQFSFKLNFKLNDVAIVCALIFILNKLFLSNVLICSFVFSVRLYLGIPKSLEFEVSHRNYVNHSIRNIESNLEDLTCQNQWMIRISSIKTIEDIIEVFHLQ